MKEEVRIERLHASLDDGFLNQLVEVAKLYGWDFATVQFYKGKHPCEKPLALMEHIITASSRPGDVVLDPFCGSGVTGIAARKHNRKFIGIERDPSWVETACRRIGAANACTVTAPRARPDNMKQQSLF